MEDDKKLADLKTIYDELWLDAKTLIKDMKKSVNIYLYAGLVTLIVAFTSLTNAAPYFVAIIFGIGNVFAWIFVIIEVALATVVITFGARLIIWYRKLKKRYAKLIEMETSGRKTDA